MTSLKYLKALIFYGSLASSMLLAFFNQTKTLGKLSLILLTLVIFTKPLVRLFPTVSLFKLMLALRRQLGQASAFAVFAHVLSQIVVGLSLKDILYFAATSSPRNFQFWGFWSLVLIIPLLLTSNDFSTNLLKRNWFRLQKLIHPLYLFSLIHYAKGDFKRTVFSLLVLFVLYFSRILAAHNVKFFVTKSQITPPSPSPSLRAYSRGNLYGSPRRNTSSR